MKPKIGLLAEVKDEGYTGAKNSYATAIALAGGIPLILPYSDNESTLCDYADIIDGFLFTGGADIDPKYYGEKTKPTCGNIFPLRDTFELQMLEKVTKKGKPIMAICRGMQVVNVFFGGTLYQDIETEYETCLSHRQSAPVNAPWHEIEILENTPLHVRIGNAKMMGNSFHHQAIKDLAPSLIATAVASDGIIEAAEHQYYSYLAAYQWHPERLCAFDADNLRLFTDFINACKK